MTAAPSIPAGLSEAQYQQIFAAAGTYQGNDAKYKGKSWGDVYAALWAANETTASPETPYQIALKTETLIVLQGGVGGLVTALGNFTTITGKSVVAGIDQFATTNPLGQVAAFLGGLGQASTWLRIAEGVLGVVLIAVGVARLTNAIPVATKIARTVA